MGFGIPRVFVMDNGTQFQLVKFRQWCEELKIKQYYTSVATPQSNGQTEVTNRIILQSLKNRLEEAKGNWVEELPGVLRAYRTIPRRSTVEHRRISFQLGLRYRGNCPSGNRGGDI
ncbi:UNVERIFIED_CONTAM: hypothetical protein Sradi_2029600 [Sesamum radiatum]|uniref:Integrase catalytic domain-containing protein n=1 Tax=Sesamum radiatum TaxID=300843 RepID=A0AAW2TG63_SESRA